jgi:hypothetical protein
VKDQKEKKMPVFDYCGEPGLVWYSKVTKKRGDELEIGDWLDSLDHSGACKIWAIGVNSRTGARYVAFSEWDGIPATDGDDSDWRMVRADVLYDVVDPDSIVDPAGEPAV